MIYLDPTFETTCNIIPELFCVVSEFRLLFLSLRLRRSGYKGDAGTSCAGTSMYRDFHVQGLPCAGTSKCRNHCGLFPGTWDGAGT